MDSIKQLIANDGYAINRRYETDLLEETWRHDGNSIEISMLAPKEPGEYPLIIYLPGLGEHANGGKFWREYRAKSGYTVFSMQPLEIGDALKELRPPHDETDDTRRKGKTKPAKSAGTYDMRYLGHHYFSTTSLAKRVDELLWSWTQLKQRAKSDQSIFAKADHRFLSGAGLLTRAALGIPGKSSMPGFGGVMPGAEYQFQGGNRNKGGPAGGGKSSGMRNDRPNTSFDANDYAIALSLSTAYLDAVGKSDRIAKAWKTELVPDWLGQSAKLNIK